MTKSKVQSLYRLCLSHGFKSVDEAAKAVGMKNRTMRDWASKDEYRPILEDRLSRAQNTYDELKEARSIDK